MVGQLVLIVVLVLVAYAVGYWVGRSNGHAAAMRWRDQVDRVSEMMQAARFDEPGSPRLN